MLKLWIKVIHNKILYFIETRNNNENFYVPDLCIVRTKH